MASEVSRSCVRIGCKSSGCCSAAAALAREVPAVDDAFKNRAERFMEVLLVDQPDSIAGSAPRGHVYCSYGKFLALLVGSALLHCKMTHDLGPIPVEAWPECMALMVGGHPGY